MDIYFTSIVDRLNLDDIQVLSSLFAQESINRISAKTKKEVLDKCHLSEARFRKSINRLDANNLIEIHTGSRGHLLFITEYGINALNYSCERNGI